MDISDGDLWSLFVRGDKAAFKELFNRYYRGLCVLSEKYVSSPTIAEDIVQDVFYSLLKKRDTITFTHSPKAFLCRSVINASLNHIKKQKREIFPDNLPDIEDDSKPEETVLNEEIYQVITKSISSLPEQCKKIFKLNRFEGLKHKEIAQNLDISIKTVKNHIGKALKIIRNDVESYYATKEKYIGKPFTEFSKNNILLILFL